MNLMKFKVWYFVFSLLIILPGLYYLITSGLRLGVDFTGGALIEYRFEKNLNVNSLREEISNEGIEVGSIIPSENNTYIIRTKPVDKSKIDNLKVDLNKKFG